MQRVLRLAIAFSIIALFILPTPANAGTELDPEIDDGPDALSYDFLDIESAWFDGPEGESNTSLDITLRMVDGPKHISDFFQDVQNNNVTTYDFQIYFDFNEAHYAVAATVQAAFVSNFLGEVIYGSQELREVDYDSYGNILNESTITQIQMEWDGDLKAMVFTVEKSYMGDPKVGDVLTHTWAAIWNADTYPNESNRSLVNAEDTGNTYNNPGRDFRFKGGLEFEYDLALYGETAKKVKPGQSVTFSITLNASTTNMDPVSITIRYGIAKQNWTIEGSPEGRNISNQAVQIPLNITVTCPKSEQNGTTVRATVYAKLTIPEANNTYLEDELELTIQVYGEYEEEDKDKSSLDEFLEFIMEPMILSIIVGIMIVVFLAAILVKRIQ